MFQTPGVGLITMLWLALAPLASRAPGADDGTPGPEVTLRGNVICSRAMEARPWSWDPKDGDHTPILFALEGTPTIARALELIMRDYPDRGLDVDDALRIQGEFVKHLTYSIAPGPISEKVHKDVEAGSRILQITGTIFEDGGRRWIRASRSEPARVSYPAKMLAPDRPFAAPVGAPLRLEISDTLTLTCIRLPAGRFLQGSPYYQPRYQDEYPHEVVLTRPFCISEIPVTQEMFESVMGKNPSPSKNPQFPVEHAAFADILEFCRVLSHRNGVTVRLPTDAEWEYAARVGTSSPCLSEKYRDQRSETGSLHNTTPVRSRKPNAWGLYDMLCGGWHVTGDYKADNVRTRQVDPTGPTSRDKEVHRDGNGLLHKTRGGPHYDHSRPNIHGAATEDGRLWEAGAMIFRVVVETGPARK